MVSIRYRALRESGQGVSAHRTVARIALKTSSYCTLRSANAAYLLCREGDKEPERLNGVQEVVGSNPASPTICPSVTAFANSGISPLFAGLCNLHSSPFLMPDCATLCP